MVVVHLEKVLIMKKCLLIFFFSFTIFFAFASLTINLSEDQVIPDQSDTIILKKDLTLEIGDSTYKRRETGYFIVIGSDTSIFMPVFSQSIQGGAISIDLRPRTFKTETYYQRLEELGIILSNVSDDYSIDSLVVIFLGRLISYGDLAVTLTGEFDVKFGDKDEVEVSEYENIKHFLLASSLTSDLNGILKPFSKKVESFHIENVLFADKEELMNLGNVSSDPSKIPDKIFDVMIWVRLTEL